MGAGQVGAIGAASRVGLLMAGGYLASLFVYLSRFLHVPYLFAMSTSCSFRLDELAD